LQVNSVRSAADMSRQPDDGPPAALFRSGRRQKRGELIGGGDGKADEGVLDPVPRVEAELLARGGEAGEVAVADIHIQGDPLVSGSNGFAMSRVRRNEPGIASTRHGRKFC
jgi:hypothetical protein